MKRKIEKTVIRYGKDGKITAVYKPPEENTGKWSSAMDWISSVVVAFFAIFLIFTFLFRAVSVSGSSMVPTLRDKDWLAITNFNYTPQKGDIVVVTQPNDFNEPIIKRIIGTGGDTIDIDFVKGIVYRNGEALIEDYTNTPTNLSYDVSFPVTVPEGFVFVMGDNRNNSLDSRSTEVGLVDERYLLGKVAFRFIPVGKFSVR